MLWCLIRKVGDELPKKTFYNLTNEKKERLLTAAYAEFSRVSLDDASINVIIQQSDISRGSFYQYFHDKEDLYFYCLDLLTDDMNAKISECFVNVDGKLIEGLIETFKFMYEHYLNGEHRLFYHQFFVNMTYRRSRNIYENEDSNDKQNHTFIDFEELVKKINTDDLKFTFETELKEFMQYMFQMMHWTIAKVFLKNLSEESAYEIIYQRLSWMANGILIKEKNKGVTFGWLN